MIGQLNAFTLGLKSLMPVLFLQLISVGRRRYRTYYHLEFPNGFQYLLESVVEDHN